MAEPAAIIVAHQAVISAAKARADEAKLAAEAPVSLPSTPAHNTLGDPLRDIFVPQVPAGEHIIPIQIHVDGAELDPPVDGRVFHDRLLWNILDASVSPDAFARLTCDDADLPAAFEAAIAEQIQLALSQHGDIIGAAGVGANGVNGGANGGGANGAPGGGVTMWTRPREAPTEEVDGAANADSRAPREKLVTLELSVEHEANGVIIEDRVLWDTSRDEPTPEGFARQLCADLGLPAMEGAVAYAVREQLARLSAERDAAKPEPAAAIIRSEADAVAWSPRVSYADVPKMDTGEA